MNTVFRNADGTFNYDAIDELNMASTTGSQMVMAKMMNNHEWYGLLSTYTTKFGEYLDFYGGIDFLDIVKNISLYDLYSSNSIFAGRKRCQKSGENENSFFQYIFG